MNKRIYGILFVIGLIIGVGMLVVRPYTGYMDADYYFAGAKTLFQGKGFWDYYLWNYLGNPASLPAPSHTYWMPMSSLVALAGMKIAGNSSLIAARSGFIILFAFVPVLMAQLSWKVFKRRDWAITSGLLAPFCGYFLRFVTEPDGFAVLFLCGILLIHLLKADQEKRAILPPLGLGLLAGMIHLTRSDGLVWLGFLVLFMLVFRGSSTCLQTIKSIFALVSGYLLVTAGWYLRLWETTGFPFPVGGVKTVYLTRYDELFSYPPDLLNFQSWIRQGWQVILAPRVQALWVNILSMVAVFGSIVLVPGMLAGASRLIKSPIAKFFIVAFASIFLLMTLLVPLVGMRGGLLHSGAIFMPAIWLIVPMGNQAVVEKIRSMKRYKDFSATFYQWAMVGILIIVSGFVVWMDRNAPAGISQANTWKHYQSIATWLDSMLGADTHRVVLVNNPPAYYAATGGSAIAVPFGGTDSILAASQQYQAEFLLLDENYKAWYPELFESESKIPGFQYLGEINGIRVFQLEVDE